MDPLRLEISNNKNISSSCLILNIDKPLQAGRVSWFGNKGL